MRIFWPARSENQGRAILSSVDIAVACAALALATIFFVFNVRLDASDLAPHRTTLDQLMERRNVIYENLRDLRFEFRAGKFSETDYEETKQVLELEAARVLADMDRLTGGTPTPATIQAATEKVRRS
jgi:hypothetical protein